MKVTFFFPKDANLDPVEVEGAPPHEGQIVYFGAFELNAPGMPHYDKKYDYNQCREWVVERVDFGVRASCQSVERVKHPNAYYAEVHLKRVEE